MYVFLFGGMDVKRNEASAINKSSIKVGVFLLLLLLLLKQNKNRPSNKNKQTRKLMESYHIQVQQYT